MEIAFNTKHRRSWRPGVYPGSKPHPIPMPAMVHLYRVHLSFTTPRRFSRRTRSTHMATTRSCRGPPISVLFSPEATPIHAQHPPCIACDSPGETPGVAGHQSCASKPARAQLKRLLHASVFVRQRSQIEASRITPRSGVNGTK